MIGSNWDAESSRDGQLVHGSLAAAAGSHSRLPPLDTAVGPTATTDGCTAGQAGAVPRPCVYSIEDSCPPGCGSGSFESLDQLKDDPTSPSRGHLARCRHWCLARGHRVLQRLSASCGPNNYALLGPVTCGELHVLSELLWYDLCQVQWLYVALQDPYRQGDFRQQATQALVCLAGALANDASLKGLVLRMPQLKLDRQQLERVIAAFGDALRINTTLTSLQLKPSGFFERIDPGGFESLVQVSRPLRPLIRDSPFQKLKESWQQGHLSIP